MARNPRIDRPSFDVEYQKGRPEVKSLIDELTTAYENAKHPSPEVQAQLDIDRIFDATFDHVGTHYSRHKQQALERLVTAQKRAMDFYEQALSTPGDVDVDVAQLERTLKDMDRDFRELARKADDIVADMPAITRADVPELSGAPITGVTPGPAPARIPDPGGPVKKPTVAAKTPEGPPKKPHERRAELLEKKREQARQRDEALADENKFGREAGDLAEALEKAEAAPPGPQRDARIKQLEKWLETAEANERAAGDRIKDIDRQLGEADAALTQLAREGPDPNAGYYRRTQPEPVFLRDLDRPGPWLESTGAGQVGGQQIEGQRVLAAIESPGAMRTHIEASAAEDFAYKDALTRGEIGIQRPGRINEGGPDFVTARRNAAGEIEIVFHDATLDKNKAIKDVDPRWITEAAEAIELKPDGSSRLQLHNRELEDAIRNAFELIKMGKKRPVVEATLVEVRPNGVLFTPLNQ